MHGKICFSVWFCNNLLLVLKMRFQVFSFESIIVQRFSSDSDGFSALSSAKPSILKTQFSSAKSQFFEILVFSQDICGNVHYLPEINLISWGTLIKPRGKKKSETQFWRRKTAEDNNAEINVSPNIPCTFLLCKAGWFLQIFFPRNLICNKFWEGHFFWIVNVWHSFNSLFFY